MTLLQQFECSHKPMLSTLFPNNLRPSSPLPSASPPWWWTVGISELSLASRMQNAASNGLAQELAELLAQKHMYFPYSTMHSSLLHCASSRDQVSIVHILLEEHHHDVNCGSRFECTPLHIALMRDHSQVAYELLIHGATVTEANLTVACQWNSSRSLQVLHLTGHLTDFALCERIAKQNGHLDLVHTLGRMQRLSRLEFASEFLQPSPLQGVLEGKPLHPLAELSRAMALMNGSMHKHLRPGREFKECKRLLLAARKRAQELFVVLLRFKLEERLLVLHVGRFLPALCEFLGLK